MSGITTYMKRRFFAVVAFCLFRSSAVLYAQTQPTAKTFQELRLDDSITWHRLQTWKQNALNPVEFLPPDSARASNALVKSQVASNTFLGTVIFRTGGILIDNGWIRILGSGCTRMDRSVPEWNRGKLASRNTDESGLLLVADDVVGGLYALKYDEPDAPESVGVIFYYGPNSLTWQSTGLNYSNFLLFCFSGDIKDFYEGFRWKGWQEDIAQINCNQVYSCYPLLWTREGIQMKSNRKVLAIQKQWDLYQGKQTPAKQKVMADRDKGKK